MNEYHVGSFEYQASECAQKCASIVWRSWETGKRLGRGKKRDRERGRETALSTYSLGTQPVQYAFDVEEQPRKRLLEGHENAQVRRVHREKRQDARRGVSALTPDASYVGYE